MNTTSGQNDALTGSPFPEEKIKQLDDARKINYTLYTISNAVNATRNLEQLYRSIYDTLNRLIPLPNFFIAIYNPDTKTINFDFFIDEHDDDFPVIGDRDIPNCLTGDVIFSKRPLFLKENMLIERNRQNKLVGSLPKVWLGVPLIVQSDVIGAIAVQHYTDPDYFTRQHLEMLVAVTEQIAIAIERKLILDALEKKEKTLSLINDNTSSIVAIINSKGMYEFANPAHRVLGYSGESLVGKSFFDLVSTQDAQPLMDFLKKSIKGKASHITLNLKIKTAQNSLHPIKGAFDIIRNKEGDPDKLIFIGEDISEDEETRKKFQMVFDSSPEAILLADLDSGLIADVNDAFCSLSGLRKDQIIGKTTMEIGIWKTWTQRRAHISNLIRKGWIGNYKANLYFKNKPVPTLVSSKPVDLFGRPHLLSIIRDISRIKELERLKIQRRKMDSIATLASGITDDLNNLLSGIQGHLELLDTDSKGFSDNQNDNISNAIIASKKAAKLIRQLQILTHETDQETAITSRKKKTSRAQTVLIIDDEDMVRDMAVKALRSFGYNALEAENGQVALKIFKKQHHSIDAVILDIIMPKMSGVETFKRIKKINPEAKVIIASGHITNKEQKKLFAKACAYLDKPYQLIELKHILEEIIGSD